MCLIIKGVEMPENCNECICLEAFDDEIYGRQYFCGILGIDALAKEHSRHKNCPLVEIPTHHGRLIDADELSISILKTMNNGDDSVIGLIDKTPTIIEAEE